jgi:hypothetical protein
MLVLAFASFSCYLLAASVAPTGLTFFFPATQAFRPGLTLFAPPALAY